MWTQSRRDLILAVLFIGFGLLFRLIPHPANLSPMIAISLFSGRLISNRILAAFVPLVSLYVSDAVMGFYLGMLWVYAAAIASVVLGHFSRKVSYPKVLGLGFASSAVFFVLSNFGVWMTTPLYAKTLAGLSECFAMALPFWQRSLVGDLVFVSLLIGCEWGVKCLSTGAKLKRAV